MQQILFGVEDMGIILNLQNNVSERKFLELLGK